MYLYRPGQNGDSELLAWYLRLTADGDLAKLYGDATPALSAFIRNYTESDIALVYDADEEGWWVVGWVKPYMGVATWGMWVRPDRRGCQAQIEFAYDLHNETFERGVPTLVLSTSQEMVVGQMQPLGYVVLGQVPHMYGAGKPGTIMQITREAFAAAREVWQGKYNERSPR